MATAGGYASANAATRQRCITKILPLAVCSPVAVCQRGESLAPRTSQSSNNIYMNNERPTPETDAFAIKFKTTCGEKYWVPVNLSRRLERQRDEALKQCGQISVMREAIKKAHTALSLLDDCRLFHADSMDIDGSTTDYCATTLTKLQPFLND